MVGGRHSKASNPKPEYPKLESNPNDQSPKEDIIAMSLSAPAPLNYEKRAPWHHRKKYHRIAIGILTFSSAAALWHWHAVIERRGELLYLQHRCLNYTAPEDQIIGMKANADVMDALAKTDPAYTTEQWFDTTWFVRRTLPFWDQYRLLIDGRPPVSIFGPSTGPPPPAVALSVLPPPGPTIAFLHARISPGGEKRLVVVYLSQEQGKVLFWELIATTYRIGNFLEEIPAFLRAGWAFPVSSWNVPTAAQ